MLSKMGVYTVTSVSNSNPLIIILFKVNDARGTSENVFHVIRRELSHGGFVQFERFHFYFVLVN